MLNTKEIRVKLRTIQPYYIETDLIPRLYFKEDEKNTEYWIFFYRYIRKLEDATIGVRLGYDRKTIYIATLKIIENNYDIILNFYSQFCHK